MSRWLVLGRGALNQGLFFCVWLFVGAVSAQDQPFVHYTERGKLDSNSHKSSPNLQSFLRNGRFFGHARFFFDANG